MKLSIIAASMLLIAAEVSPAAPVTQPSDADYQACRQVLQSIQDDFDNEDPSAASALVYFAPDTDPQFVHLEPLLSTLDSAAYRLKKDAVAKFSTHAIGVNFYVGDGVAEIDELLNRIGPKDYTLTGDTLVINPPAPFLSHTIAWPKAPMYFKKVGADWKLDASRTYKLVVDVQRTVPIPGETPEQTAVAVVKEITDTYQAVASDVEQNNIATAADLQKRLDKLAVGLTLKYRQITVHQVPNQPPPPTGNL